MVKDFETDNWKVELPAPSWQTAIQNPWYEYEYIPYLQNLVEKIKRRK